MKVPAVQVPAVQAERLSPSRRGSAFHQEFLESLLSVLKYVDFEARGCVRAHLVPVQPSALFHINVRVC